ncbi:cation:proton antiporter [Methanocella arvoryzae]|nr:cation:proton antiporter [Methanocella arvoryzae]
MLLVGKILGDLVKRLGFSPLIGQMLAGIILGPMLLNLVPINHEIELLTTLGILFMMFYMGLSIDIEKVMGQNVYGFVVLSVFGGTLTFFVTATVTALLGFSLNTVLLVGISFISTSTAIGFMVLNEIGDIRSKVYKTVIAVGISDDIYAIVALALFTSYLTTGVDIRSAFMLFLLVLGFIIMVLGFGKSITSKLINYARRTQDDQSIIAFSIILLFLVAFLSQSVGIASVTGAFLAGTILARSPLSFKVITPKIEAITEGFFVPLFFVITGVRINIFEILSSESVDLMIASIPIDVVLFLGLLMAVMVSKYVGTYLATTFMGGYKDSDHHKMAISMMPMGEYTLVIGQIGLITYIGGAPILGESTYSVLALIVLVSSIIVPIMLRAAYGK